MTSPTILSPAKPDNFPLSQSPRVKQTCCTWRGCAVCLSPWWLSLVFLGIRPGHLWDSDPHLWRIKNNYQAETRPALHTYLIGALPKLMFQIILGSPVHCVEKAKPVGSLQDGGLMGLHAHAHAPPSSVCWRHRPANAATSL
jgi:hypothetical protein